MFYFLLYIPHSLPGGMGWEERAITYEARAKIQPILGFRCSQCASGQPCDTAIQWTLKAETLRAR